MPDEPDLSPSDAPSPLDDPTKSWAAELLGVPRDASSTQRRKHIARMLDQVSMIPPPDWDEAIRVLSGQESAGTQFHRKRQALLLKDVDLFLDTFFDLDPAERRKRHLDLVCRCESTSALRSHLEKLTAGLDVVISAGGDRDPYVGAWASLLCRLFVAFPATRASLRRDKLAEMADHPRVWLESARELELRQAALVNLDRNAFQDSCAYLNRIRETEEFEFRWVSEVESEPAPLVDRDRIVYTASYGNHARESEAGDSEGSCRTRRNRRNSNGAAPVFAFAVAIAVVLISFSRSACRRQPFDGYPEPPASAGNWVKAPETQPAVRRDRGSIWIKPQADWDDEDRRIFEQVIRDSLKR